MARSCMSRYTTSNMARQLARRSIIVQSLGRGSCPSRSRAFDGPAEWFGSAGIRAVERTYHRTVKKARTRWTDSRAAARERLAVLEQLWAAAAATAIFTIGLNVAFIRFDVTLPDWLSPAQGFIVAAVVSAVGYWRVRERRREAAR